MNCSVFKKSVWWWLRCCERRCFSNVEQTPHLLIRTEVRWGGAQWSHPAICVWGHVVNVRGEQISQHTDSNGHLGFIQYCNLHFVYSTKADSTPFITGLVVFVYSTAPIDHVWHPFTSGQRWGNLSTALTCFWVDLHLNCRCHSPFAICVFYVSVNLNWHPFRWPWQI